MSSGEPRPQVFVIDNYDSFTYNLVQLAAAIGAEVEVRRNDKVSLADIEAWRPTHLLISPGPGTPDQAGISMAAIAYFGERLPVLGVCLGHQAIGQVYGAAVRRGAHPVHGKTAAVHHDGSGIFTDVPSPFTATRYHSLVVDEQVPATLVVNAWTADGVVMGVRHRDLPVHGVQFHPESALTVAGEMLLRTFLGVPQRREERDERRRPPQAGGEKGRLPMPNEVLTAALQELVGGHDLSAEQARAVLSEIMAGRANDVQAAAVLTALRAKGETAIEIVGLARAMAEFAETVDFEADIILDTCGTGGDNAGTFNISTTAALVAAGAGAVVAKHGNRSATSNCGSADVLEALGVRIDLAPDQVKRCLQDVGIAFMFAPRHHAAMKHLALVRAELGIRTIFNLIGPLTNPAGARHQLIGVSEASYVEILAEAVKLMGSARNLVVHSDDGLDEITISGPTQVVEVFAAAKDLKRYTVTPEEFGLQRATIAALKGGDAVENAAIVRAVLAGEAGPRRDVVLLNAGAAIYIAELADSIAAGVEIARQTIDSGAASAKLAALIAASQTA
ncbi:MAG: anthranilate phosphoribosyltransferase [Thermoleophilia bacterium]